MNFTNEMAHREVGGREGDREGEGESEIVKAMQSGVKGKGEGGR